MYNNKFNYENDKYQCIYNPIESYKIINIKHIINTIRRVSHTKRIHINQIRYTDNDLFFICPISTKEIKNAGKNLSSAMLTITSLQVDFDVLFDIVKSESRYEKNYIKGKDEYRVAFGMYLSNFYIKRKDVSSLKQINTFILLYIYDSILSVTSVANSLCRTFQMLIYFALLSN